MKFIDHNIVIEISSYPDKIGGNIRAMNLIDFDIFFRRRFKNLDDLIDALILLKTKKEEYYD